MPHSVGKKSQIEIGKKIYPGVTIHERNKIVGVCVCVGGGSVVWLYTKE